MPRSTPSRWKPRCSSTFCSAMFFVLLRASSSPAVAPRTRRRHARGMLIRDATPTYWPAIWPFLRQIVAAGETFCWDRDVTEEQARAMWLHQPPGRTVVAVAEDGTVLGTAETHPNY